MAGELHIPIEAFRGPAAQVGVFCERDIDDYRAGVQGSGDDAKLFLTWAREAGWSGMVERMRAPQKALVYEGDVDVFARSTRDYIDTLFRGRQYLWEFETRLRAMVDEFITELRAKFHAIAMGESGAGQSLSDDPQTSASSFAGSGTSRLSLN